MQAVARAQGGKRRRYAIVGTGVRGIGMWGRPLVERYSDVLEFVGLCDVNPLRVLDSKDETVQDLMAGAPKIGDYLCEECATHFAELRRGLDALDRP